MVSIGKLFNIGSLFRPQARIVKDTAVIDRFESSKNGGRLAVLLVGKQERVVDVPVKSLPKGAKEGDWLQVELKGDKLVKATVDKAATDKARQEIQDLFESVLAKPENKF